MAEGQLTVDNCGHGVIDLDVHPITKSWIDYSASVGVFYNSPDVQRALDNVVKSGIVEAYSMFVTDSNGSYSAVALRDRRIVTANVEGLPAEVGTEMLLDHVTGNITSNFPDQRVWLTIGYYIDGYMPLIV